MKTPGCKSLVGSSPTSSAKPIYFSGQNSSLLTSRSGVRISLSVPSSDSRVASGNGLQTRQAQFDSESELQIFRGGGIGNTPAFEAEDSRFDP